MADRRRVADERESDKLYLEKSGVNEIVKDLIIKLVSNRPDEPLDFIADYFSSMNSDSNHIDKAKQRLLLAHHSSPAFMLNIRAAYETLSEVRADKRVAGINGILYEQLLDAITTDLHDSIKQRLFAKIKCRSYEAVHFDVFQSGIFTTFILKDFLNHAAELYSAMDVAKAGQVDRPVADVVLSQLHASIAAPATVNSHILEGSYNLSPEKLGLALSQAAATKEGVRPTISKDIFINKAADTFLLKVSVLR